MALFQTVVIIDAKEILLNERTEGFGSRAMGLFLQAMKREFGTEMLKTLCEDHVIEITLKKKQK